jgi:hypothetical protein
MRAAALAFAFAVATAARADDDRVVLRQFVGIGGSVSDAGAGFGAQLGLRISPILLRVTVDIGGGTAGRGYVLPSVRADWLFPIASRNLALVAGLGYGDMTYGFILDSPTANLIVLTPEIGILVGPDRLLGRLFLGVTGLVPLQSVSHERDSAGVEIAPPRVMATLLLSL